MSTTCLRTPARPDLLVGKWVRVDRDGGRPPHLGVLARATPDPDHPGLWQWALRTPTGYMAGGPHLPAESLTRAHTADVARARRALTRQLRADRAVLADLRAHGEPAGAMARAVAVLEELQTALAAQLKP
ncbi:hypothetical protein Q8791_27145 [Nocardiopsis sp. CT-R113]|uniref:Uncharacterized protein n=1 Tax=Nocardiopsis codii TaxID=3065942 RepID=A0ABU7KH16_9ACTN|nr:hypothetical protein [Nocardiopsis sp. CT-R113]MEE2040902.1 hypothetical protein [Nocardiopsis sp. CT-R113]